MPYLTKPKRKYNKKEGVNKDIAKLYNTSQWRNLRQYYISQHPICEICEKEYNDGKRELEEINPTEEIHHIIPISKGSNIDEMMKLCLTENNLRGLCKFHHHKIHNIDGNC